MKEQSASGILATAIDRIKEMVDCQTIVGDAIDAGEGIRIIPISKVTYGFASGGTDFPTKSSKELFGGGGGAGVTISPVAFLVIKDGEVSVKYISDGPENQAERIISMVPDVVNKVTDVVSKFKTDKTTEVVDSVFDDAE